MKAPGSLDIFNSACFSSKWFFSRTDDDLFFPTLLFKFKRGGIKEMGGGEISHHR